MPRWRAVDARCSPPPLPTPFYAIAGAIALTIFAPPPYAIFYLRLRLIDDAAARVDDYAVFAIDYRCHTLLPLLFLLFR